MSENGNTHRDRFKYLWHGEETEVAYFDEKVLERLAERHGIPNFPGVAQLLELAARAYWKQVPRQEKSYRASRKELAKLRKQVSHLMDGINGLSNGASAALEDASLTINVVPHLSVEILSQTLDSPDNTTSTSEFDEAQVNNVPFDRRRIQDVLSEFAQVLELAERWAGKDEDGPVPNEALQSLLQMCQLVWTELKRADFTEAWQGEAPYSPATQFCVDVAKIVDRDIRHSQIKTQFRKVRENPLSISDLSKLLEEFDGLRNQIS